MSARSRAKDHPIGSSATSNMIVVANRLPVRRVGSGDAARWVQSSGGLVTALSPVLRSGDGAWVGWTGVPGAAPAPFEVEGMRCQPVELSSSEVDDFYHGMSNRTFWPLYHDSIRTPAFHRKWWAPYVEVNRRFAEQAVAAAAPGDTIWVHDYHLQLVPRMVRRLRSDVRIGFFLHIPFPPAELFEWLPWREEILAGLLGADVVGFQTAAASRNFARLCRTHTSARGTDSRLDYEGRSVRVGAFPISIEFDWFNECAARPDVQRRAAEIRERVGAERRILLAVDRLDYTKGIDVRVKAFGETLSRGLASVNDCVLLQVAVPSREDVIEYAEMRSRAEEVIGTVNGEYSQPGRVAVQYFRRNLNREELVAYYLAADVMLVTPLRDGMNLVAKEYVASRPDGDGVLVLSEFAGAAQEMKRALLVNPRDIDRMAETFGAALSMPRSQRRPRMAALRRQVQRHDVHRWSHSFLDAIHEQP